jgi:hypothetical protein
MITFPHIEVPSPLHDFSSSVLDEGQNLGGHRELGAKFSTSKSRPGLLNSATLVPQKFTSHTRPERIAAWLRNG